MWRILIGLPSPTLTLPRDMVTLPKASPDSLGHRYHWSHQTHKLPTPAPQAQVRWVWGGAWASSGSHRLAVLGDADQFHLPVNSGLLVLVVGTATCPREGRARFGGPEMPGSRPPPPQERGVPQERCDQRFPRAGGGLAPTQGDALQDCIR